jgi:tricin synthase
LSDVSDILGATELTEEMGCVSSKILAKSGSYQEKGSLGHSFQRSSVIEEIILSSSKSNGDQFLALLCASNSAARKVKEPQHEQSLASVASVAVAEPAAKIETIDVSELLAGLEEENANEQSDRKDGDRSPGRCVSDGGAAGRARSFRTVEEFDALVTQGGSLERAAERDEPRAAAPATAEAAESSGGECERGDPAGQGEEAEAAGARRRARARQLGELNVPAAFDFSKSGSLRDWLRQGGQIFSPGSYVTPKFGAAPALPATAKDGGYQNHGEQQQEHALFDPELVAQFERAMEQLSEDEGRVLDGILEALESEAGEKDGAASFGRVSNDQPAPTPVAAQRV